MIKCLNHFSQVVASGVDERTLKREGVCAASLPTTMVIVYVLGLPFCSLIVRTWLWCHNIVDNLRAGSCYTGIWTHFNNLIYLLFKFDNFSIVCYFSLRRIFGQLTNVPCCQYIHFSASATISLLLFDLNWFDRELLPGF